MPDIRGAMLAVIDKLVNGGGGGSLQSSTVLNDTAILAGIQRGSPLEQAVLTQFGELFRTGYLAWGLNFSNPSPPFFHVTEQGRRTLANLSSDPANPAGYLARIDALDTMNPIARSYLAEALDCFVGDLNKAAAVMVGAASESLIIELRDVVQTKLGALGRPVPKDLTDWRALRVLHALNGVFDQQRKDMPRKLRDEYEAFWPAFTQQIRGARNDAGHPASIDPVTQSTVHASLLILPELLKLSAELRGWVASTMR